jgi:hypothetical protein
MKPSAASICVTAAFSIGIGIVIGLCIPDFPQPASNAKVPQGPSAALSSEAASCEERLETRAVEVAGCSEDLQTCYQEKERCERAIQSNELLQLFQVCNEDLQKTKRLLDVCLQGLGKD